MRDAQRGIAALAGACALSVAAAAGATGAPGPWTVETTPAPSVTFNRLNGVAATSGAVWAVGSYETATQSRTLILERGTAGWVRQPSANRTGSNELFAVKATSRTNAWAVGDHDNGVGLGVLILHYNGTRWATQAAPHSGFSSCGSAACSYGLNAVAALSASDAWAVGAHACRAIECPELTLVEHWNGRSWKVQPSPNFGGVSELTGVAAWNNSHVWATGTDHAGTVTTGNGHGFIERWNGHKWQLVTLPKLGFESALDAVTAVSASNVWAVGTYAPHRNSTERTLVLHWNGAHWLRVSSPNRGTGAFNELHAVKSVSAHDIWAVGGYRSGQGAERTLIEHYNGASWTVSSSPNVNAFDNGLTAVTGRSTTSVFAVGSAEGDANDDSSSPLALHCC